MTPQDLVELEQIRRLKHAYCRCVDTKDFTALGALFVPDGTAAYGGGAITLSGRQAIVEYLTAAMGTSMLTSHIAVMPEIELTSATTATGVWALRDVVLLTDLGLVIRGASYYDDRYVKTGDGWRIQHTGYKRLYEEMGKAPQDQRITASWWTTDGVSRLV